MTLYLLGKGISDCSNFAEAGDDGFIIRRSYTKASFWLLSAWVGYLNCSQAYLRQ